MVMLTCMYVHRSGTKRSLRGRSGRLGLQQLVPLLFPFQAVHPFLMHLLSQPLIPLSLFLRSALVLDCLNTFLRGSASNCLARKTRACTHLPLCFLLFLHLFLLLLHRSESSTFLCTLGPRSRGPGWHPWAECGLGGMPLFAWNNIN
jgi:hypothetical protein